MVREILRLFDISSNQNVLETLFSGLFQCTLPDKCFSSPGGPNIFHNYLYDLVFRIFRHEAQQVHHSEEPDALVAHVRICGGPRAGNRPGLPDLVFIGKTRFHL
jgi:hypothetical protein